jgi:hypothetical protein
MSRPRLSLIIPFRDDDGSRTVVKEWIVARWSHHVPEAQIVVHADDGGVPFSKTLAVNLAFEQTTGDVVGILDADVWIEPAHTWEAVDRIARGEARWVIPASRVFRYTEAATARLLAQDPTLPLPPRRRGDFESIRKIWGLFHLFPRSAFEALGGFDPRFRGWGGEDSAAIVAMDTIWGPHTRLPHDLFHLYHPNVTDSAGDSIWVGQTARNTGLRDRYASARDDPEAMRAILAEARTTRSPSNGRDGSTEAPAEAGTHAPDEGR